LYLAIDLDSMDLGYQATADSEDRDSERCRLIPNIEIVNRHLYAGIAQSGRADEIRG